jgi:hypothetical protein
MVFPEAVTAAKSFDATLCTDAGARENYDFWGLFIGMSEYEL